MRGHELLELPCGLFELFDNHGRRIDQPDLLGRLFCFSRKQRDGLVYSIPLSTEVEDVAVGLGVVQHPVGAGEGLDEAVIFQVLVNVERVQVLRVEAGEQHVHDDGNVDLLLPR